MLKSRISEVPTNAPLLPKKYWFAFSVVVSDCLYPRRPLDGIKYP